MRVAIIDEELPFPTNSGKRLRTLNLISRLASKHQITYLCHRNPDAVEQSQAERHLRELGVELRTVPREIAPKSGVSFYCRLASNLFSPVPYSVQSHDSHALRKVVQELSAKGDIDLWHVEWTPYAQCVRGMVTAPWLVMAHNIESQIWLRYYQSERNPFKRWYIGHQLRKFRRFEQQVFEESSQNVVVSESDAELAADWFSVRRPEVVANGVDLGFFRPVTQGREPTTVLFLGSLDWRPNQDAVRFLLDRVWPGLYSRLPDLRLSVVGRKPPTWMIEAIRRQQGVELHADVPDVRPHLEAAHAMVVPLRIGGGSRLKILEAAAAGLPVVSTAVGAEGLSLSPGRHYLEAESAESIADALAVLISDPATGDRIATAARRHVQEHYGWDACAERLDEIWRRCGRFKTNRSRLQESIASR